MGIDIQKFKTYRLKLKFSQNALEKAAGVGLGTISRLEAGKGGITVETLQKLASKMGVPTAIFLVESDNGGSYES